MASSSYPARRAEYNVSDPELRILAHFARMDDRGLDRPTNWAACVGTLKEDLGWPADDAADLMRVFAKQWAAAKKQDIIAAAINRRAASARVS